MRNLEPRNSDETVAQYLARTLPRPFTRSKTARKAHATDARRLLAAYREYAADGTGPIAAAAAAAALTNLAAAEASLRMALYQQTYGRAGEKFATRASVLRDWGLLP